MTTLEQDNAFRKYVIPSSLLGQAIEWIMNNMKPEEVFEARQLERWAENNGYTKLESK